MNTTVVPVEPAVWLCALNLALVAALPRVFFRPGRLNASWWLTAAPFFVAGTGLLLQTAAVAKPLSAAVSAPVHSLLQLVAASLAAGSILLIGLTLGSHREPVSLWHQQDDTPARIVAHGAYARIRHPFYAAFLLALLACLAAAPGAPTLLAFIAAALQLQRTARREERRLLNSPLGVEYREYMQRTGRFVPGRRRRTAAQDSRATTHQAAVRIVRVR